MADPQSSANFRAIMDAGYLIERDVSNRGRVSLRATRDNQVCFSATAASDAEASARILAQMRAAPMPGSPAVAAARRQEVLDRPDLWPTFKPKPPERP